MVYKSSTDSGNKPQVGMVHTGGHSRWVIALHRHRHSNYSVLHAKSNCVFIWCMLHLNIILILMQRFELWSVFNIMGSLLNLTSRGLFAWQHVPSSPYLNLTRRLGAGTEYRCPLGNWSLGPQQQRDVCCQSAAFFSCVDRWVGEWMGRKHVVELWGLPDIKHT